MGTSTIASPFVLDDMPDGMAHAAEVLLIVQRLPAFRCDVRLAEALKALKAVRRSNMATGRTTYTNGTQFQTGPGAVAAAARAETRTAEQAHQRPIPADPTLVKGPATNGRALPTGSPPPVIPTPGDHALGIHMTNAEPGCVPLRDYGRSMRGCTDDGTGPEDSSSSSSNPSSAPASSGVWGIFTSIGLGIRGGGGGGGGGGQRGANGSRSGSPEIDGRTVVENGRYMPVEVLRWVSAPDQSGALGGCKDMKWGELVRLIGLTASDVVRPPDPYDDYGRPIDPRLLGTGWFRPNLLQRYGIRGIDLTLVPGFNLNHLAGLVPSAKELQALGLTAQTLARWYGLRAYHLQGFWIEPEAWRSLLGLTGELFMGLLEAKSSDIGPLVSGQRPQQWRWSPRDFVLLKLSADDMTFLGFEPRR